MINLSAIPKNILAALCAVLAVFCFSINDSSIKFLSGEYALHQIVLIRSALGMIVLLAIFVPLSGTFTILKTKRLGFHLLRGLSVVFANLTFFLGISVLPLAEGTAIFFISPMLITVFSVIFLKEKVGPHRWGAVVLGLIGVLIILRPGTSAFKLAALLPIASAIGYASLHMMTRHIGKTESALTMSFYIQFTFIIICTGFGIVAGDGRFAGHDSVPLEFLLRAWAPLAQEDWGVFLLIGVASAFGGFLISQAYRIAEAGMVAPFEYAAMPLSIFWGFMIFNVVPGMTTLLGMGLILFSGLYVIWRETVRKSAKVSDTPRYRR